MPRLWRPAGSFRARAGTLERVRDPAVPRSPDDPAYPPIGDIRHRSPADMTLPELAAALQGSPGFDGLDGANGGRGPAGAAGAAGSDASASLLYMEAGITVPSWLSYGTTYLNPGFNIAKPQGTRFYASKKLVASKVVMALGGFTTQGAATIEVGLYSATGATRHAVTSLIAWNSLAADNASRYVELPFGASFTLVKGTIYTLVVNYHATVAFASGILACDSSSMDSNTLVEREVRRLNADVYDATGRLKYASQFLCGDTYAALPADLTSGGGTPGGSGAQGSAGPVGVLLV